MNAPLRVTLNANVLLAPVAGVGRYVSELGQALLSRHDVELQFIHGLPNSNTLPQHGLKHYSALSNLAKRVLPSPYRLKRWLERHALTRAIRHQGSELYHEPSLWPLEVDCPTTMTLHDLAYVHFPETLPADRLKTIERSMAYALENSRQIICVSEFTAQQAMRHYGLSRQRISITPLGVSTCFRPFTAEQASPLLQRLGLSHRNFMLCVGTLEPRKNLELVFQAIRTLPSSLLEHCPLVLCGAYGWGKLPETMGSLHGCGQVISTGYLTGPELCTLMGSAQMLLFPSLYEGFGLPILEAMASGTPVITSNRASMPEVGANAAHYIDPYDASDLAMAIRRLHEDRQYWLQLQRMGLERAQAFTWARTAELTVEAYRSALH